MLVSPEDYHRSVAISKMREYMRYGAQQYREDWESAVAVAKMMAVNGEQPHLKTIMDSCFMRIEAYLANNPDARPWEG